MNTFFEEDLVGVLKKANITAEEISTATKDDEDLEEEYSCPLCCDDFKMKDTSILACSHRFCNGCWETHMTIKIRDGESRTMKCMAYKCNEAIDDAVVRKVISNPDLLGKYEKSIVESYIEDNKNLKWCNSTPSCGNCVQVLLPPTTPLEITCTCNHEFCFKCQNIPHLPCTCEMLKAWLQVCSKYYQINIIFRNVPTIPRHQIGW
jgi:ariadne-1